MGKAAVKKQAKSDFIDIHEINDTMATNEELIRTLIHNYHGKMAKIGSKTKSNFSSNLTRNREGNS